MGAYAARRVRTIDTLRVSLEASGSTSTQGIVVFELCLEGNRTARVQVSADEMQLPANLKEVANKYRYSQPSFVIPESVTTSLLEGMAQQPWDDDPIWLKLDPPGSVLSILPWESLLQATLKKRILRLSFPTSGYFPNWDSLDIVVCASAPQAKEAIPIDRTVPALAKRILDTQKKKTTVHIFTDAMNYPFLKTKLADKIVPKGEHGVTIYDPASAAKYEPPRRSSEIVDEREKITNPWLRWMMDSLVGQTIDLVHFVCHGFLYTDQGALALAESPTINKDNRAARFVGPRQLNAFLDCVGAYTTAFCSPVRNYSIPALRLLSEQVARLRPGVSMLHNAQDDPNFEDLCMTYDALYSADRSKLTDATSFTSLYCSPKLLKKAEAENTGVPINTEFDPAIAKDDGAWVSSGYRWLERTASQISAEPAQASTKQALEETLQFVSNVINQHSLKK